MSVQINPYESPAADPGSLLVPNGLRVEGQQLVVRSGTVLPRCCVKTDAPLAEADLRQKSLYWCSPLVGLLILLSGPLLILVYCLARKRCLLTFGLAPRLRRSYRNWWLFKILAASVLFFVMPLMAIYDSPAPVLIVAGLFIVAVISLFMGNSPLAITKHHQGEFWITGCSPEFLRRITSYTGVE